MKASIGCVQILLVLLAPLLLHGQSSKPESAREAKVAITKLEDRWLKAIEGSDIAALDSILADDFIRPVPAAGRFITKAQLLDYYKSHKSSASASKHIENLSVTLYGSTALARGNVVTTDTAGNVVAKNLFTDVFILRNNRWQVVSAQEDETSNH